MSPPQGTFLTLETAESLARMAATRFVAGANEAQAERGRFFVALSGGSTPRPAYELLATPDFSEQIDWSRVHVFWGDERAVPPDHPQSNYRMAREVLLDKVPIPAANVHRIRGELAAQRAAAVYATELDQFLGALDQQHFDLLILGMGEDGHIASLFPGSTALLERARTAVAVYVEQLSTWRITLTLPIINLSRNVLFLVSGTGKAGTVTRVRAGESLPATMVCPSQGTVTWLLDRAAAGA